MLSFSNLEYQCLAKESADLASRILDQGLQSANNIEQIWEKYNFKYG